MGPFVYALLFGAVQAVLLVRLADAAIHGRRLRTLLLAVVKFAAYGVGVNLLINRYLMKITESLCGFVVGLALMSLLIVVYRLRFHKRR